mgnify:CR=1 FL=1
MGMTHQEIVDILWKNPSLIKSAMGWDTIWVKAKEFRYNSQTEERADMVVQNQYNPSLILPGTICAVIEVKSDKADHEVLGQLTKAVRIFDLIGNQTQFWESTTGIAIAPAFTASAVELLRSEKYTALEMVSHSSGFILSKVKG